MSYNITTLFQGPDISHMVILISKEAGKNAGLFYFGIWAHRRLKQKLVPLLKERGESMMG